MIKRNILKLTLFSIKAFLLTALLCVLVNYVSYADKSEDYDTSIYTEKIENINDGYYYKLRFKKLLNKNGYFYGEYEDLHVEEFEVFNENPDKKPFTIKASEMGWNTFKCSYYSTGSSIFYIMELNKERFIRVYNQSPEGEAYYHVFSETGRTIEKYVDVFDFIDDKKDLIMSSSIVTKIYDLDFNKLIEFPKNYNVCKIFECGEPEKDLIYFGIMDKDWNFESGGIVLDRKMNIVYENLEFEPNVITDKEINIQKLEGGSMNWRRTFYNRKDISYNHILFIKSVNNVKYKNGESAGETFIIDMNLNKVFSTYKKLVSETEYYIDDEHIILLVFDNEYLILDKDMQVIESGDANSEEFKNKKEMYDFNSSANYEFNFKSA